MKKIVLTLLSLLFVFQIGGYCINNVSNITDDVAETAVELVSPCSISGARSATELSDDIKIKLVYKFDGSNVWKVVYICICAAIIITVVIVLVIKIRKSDEKKRNKK